MALLTVDKMYIGEMAEITFFNLELADAAAASLTRLSGLSCTTTLTCRKVYFP